MSKVDLDRFVADLKSNKDLQEAVAKGAGGLQAAVAVARSRGYNITVDEARQYLREKASNLSDKELDALAGGKGGSSPPPPPSGTVTSVSTVQTVSSVTSVATVAEAAETVAAATSAVVVAEGAVVLT